MLLLFEYMLPFDQNIPIDVLRLSGCFRKHFSGMVLPARRRARNGGKRGSHPINTMTMNISVKIVLLFRMLKKNTHSIQQQILQSLHLIQTCLRYFSFLSFFQACPCDMSHPAKHLRRKSISSNALESFSAVFGYTIQILNFILCYDEPVNCVAIYSFGTTKQLLHILQEGDVIAYRLIELSTSWTPELSSFRVNVKSAFGLYYTKIFASEVICTTFMSFAGWENIAV